MNNHFLLATILLLLSMATAFPQPTKKLLVKHRTDHSTTLAREPMVVEHPNGTLFLTGYRNAGTVPQLWKSGDGGTTWEQVMVGTVAEGAQGNSDVDLAVDSKGTLYFLSMQYTQLPEDTTNFDFSTMKGEHIAVGVSTDGGQSWKWTYLSQNSYDDRPWVAIAPDDTAHVIWNDGNGIHHKKSSDGGNSWVAMPTIHPTGGSSHFAIGPQGELAVRVAPMSASGFKFTEGVDLIRLSTDGGHHWTDVEIPGKRVWSAELFKGTPRWVEPLGWDPAGNLYYLWSEGNQLKLGKSADYGDTWETWLVAESDQTLYFPYMTVSNGTVSCSWISGFQEDLRHHAAVLEATQDRWEIHQTEPLKLDIWTRFEGMGHNLATGGEYFPILRLANGDFGMVTTIQNRKDDRFGFTWWVLTLP